MTYEFLSVTRKEFSCTPVKRFDIFIKPRKINQMFTAIISDLHLCEAEPVHPKYPLWKKFKTGQFFFDKQFKIFLSSIESLSNGNQIELILNGDIFDFDSVTVLPLDPPYRLNWVEITRGLNPEEHKSTFKIQKIITDHPIWFGELSSFIKRGNKVVFVIGNHDLELHFPRVQEKIKEALNLTGEELDRITFSDFFYISNNDTLVEHGNQYDPYCVCQNPISPFIRKFNRIEVRLPFGNLASRYMINSMGFFNPHADSNYIMSASEYWRFFTKYLIRTQPLIIWTWFSSAVLVLTQSFLDRLMPEVKNPLTIEDRVEAIAKRSNATPRMVRELAELRVHPASSNPLQIARELWLDRAFLVGIAFILTYILILQIKILWSVSLFWMFIPLFLFLPFFIFYSKSVVPQTMKYKEPRERTLSIAGQITKVRRVVYGHTHVIRHEWLGEIEHLNPGTWSPAFEDVECTRPVGKKAFVWIYPTAQQFRQAEVFEFQESGIKPVKGPEMLSLRAKVRPHHEQRARQRS